MRVWEQKLLNPFKQSEVEWRVQSCGITGNNAWAMALCYVTARACQARLDEVFGMDGWKDEYLHLANGVQCTIHFLSPNSGEWCYKTNGAPETDIEAFKGGYSKSFVRCCSNLGIGRYLYNLDNNFAEASTTKQKGWKKAQTKDRKDVYWKEPILPQSALPKAIIDKKLDFDAKDFVENNNIDTFNFLKQLAGAFKIDSVTFESITPEMNNYIVTNKDWYINTYGL